MHRIPADDPCQVFPNLNVTYIRTETSNRIFPQVLPEIADPLLYWRTDWHLSISLALIHELGKIIPILTWNRMRMQRYYSFSKWTLLRRTLPVVKCSHMTSSRCKIWMPSVSDVIYDNLSHRAASHMLIGRNVNVMLEFKIANCSDPSGYQI